MQDFNIYGLGGCGINVLNTYMEKGQQSCYVKHVVGLDFSTANQVVGGLYPVERLEGGEGSGGHKATHSKAAQDFVKQVLAKHQPNKLNIIVYAASGGTGSLLGPYMVKELIERDVPVLSIVIGDITSVGEMNNTVSTLRSMAAQASRLDAPVLYCYHANKTTTTQGSVNVDAVRSIDSALVMLNLTNERLDFADVKNFFFFNKVTKAEPVLAQMSFRDQGNVKEYNRIPVAALSLFGDIDQISSPFEDLLYRKAGLFSEHTKGYTEAAHAILDHGTTLKQLEEMMKVQESKQDELAGRFKVKTEVTNGANDDGMFL